MASDVRAHLSRRTALLAEAGLHQLRRADRADCDHAHGAGRKEKMDRRGAFPACAEFLHAVAGTGSDAARALLWLVAPWDAWWHCGRAAVFSSVGRAALGTELGLRRAWQRAMDCRDFLWAETSRHGDRRG